jgi:hypothetical protein
MAFTYFNGPRLAYGHETVGTLTSAKALTPAAYHPSDAIHPEQAFMTVETAGVMWTVDGTTPTTIATTNVGHFADAKDVIVLEGNQNIAQFRVINAVASSGAVVKVTYLR